MKRIIVLCLVMWCVALMVIAQESKFVGTWAPSDSLDNLEYIKIDVDDGRYFVNVERVNTDDEGMPHKSYYEGENVELQSDGSLSFYVCLHENLRCGDGKTVSVLIHYNVIVYDGKLYSLERWDEYYYDQDGLKEVVYDRNPNQYIYYNERDNW